MVARERMAQAGIPIVSGAQQIITLVTEARQIVKQPAYPVVLKAAAGGGGNGMRVVANDKDLENLVKWPDPRPGLPLVMIGFTWKNNSNDHVISKF